MALISMIRQIRKFVRSQRERVLSLVVLPAFILASLPQSACICAGGHRELHCNPAACRAISHGPLTGIACGCSCCPSQSKSYPRSCCQAKDAPHQPAHGPLGGISATTSGCCQPIIAAAPNALPVEKHALAAESDLAAGLAAPLAVIDEAPFQLAGIDRARHGPPPRDAVILFLHLTI